MRIYTVDALAGSGKTKEAISYSLSQAELGAKIALVQPSTALIDQTQRNLEKHNASGVQIRKLHSDCVNGQVKDKIQDHLRAAARGVGEILLITQQSFLSLPYWHNAKDWVIIIDEIPQCQSSWSANLPVNHSAFTSHVVLQDPANNHAMLSTKQGSEAEIQRMAECRFNDDQDRIYQNVCDKLHNHTIWDTYAEVSSWHKVVNGDEMGQHSLITYSLLRPLSFAKYKSVTIMGAMITESVLYKLWSKQVEFVKHEAISAKLSSQPHANGHLLTIKYMFENDWSKTFRDSKVDGQSIQATVKAKIEELMDGKLYIYATNNDDKTGLNFGIRAPNVCHGLNTYHTVHNAVFMSALNSRYADFGFMKANGVSPDELKQAQSHQVMYQTIMRTSLRVAGDGSPKTVIVMDRRSADYLQRYFPNCTVEAIGMAEPGKKESRTPQKRQGNDWRGAPTTTQGKTESRSATQGRVKAKGHALSISTDAIERVPNRVTVRVAAVAIRLYASQFDSFLDLLVAGTHPLLHIHVTGELHEPQQSEAGGNETARRFAANRPTPKPPDR